MEASGGMTKIRRGVVAILYAQRMMRWFWLIDFTTRLLGIRNHLRCPRCRAIGTWKPHGGWFERHADYHVPRYLCKWCGLYFRSDLPDCFGEAHLGGKVWEEGEGDTPMSLALKSECGAYDPWAG